MNNRWVTGEVSGLSFPADPDALCDGDVTFLTKAFHTSGIADQCFELWESRDLGQALGAL